MRTRRRTHLWMLAFALAAWPSAGYAQLSGEGLPDLSGIADKISGTVAPKTGGTFTSGLKVPSVNPGATAKGIGKTLKDKIEAQSGQKQPALQQLEDGMPKALAMMEDQLVKVGLAKRDLGVAVGYAFVTNYEVATGKKVPQDASVTAGKTVALAIAKIWGPKFKTLSAADQEEIYEKLMVTPMILEAFQDQFAKAGKDSEAQAMQQASASIFKTLFGAPASDVTIDGAGRISGLKGSSAPATNSTTNKKTTTKAKSNKTPDVVLPKGGLVAATTGGAKIFVRYRMVYGTSMEVRLEPLIMFPDGSAFDGVPNDPLPDFSVASLKKYSKPYDVGTWKATGKKLALTFDGKTETYIKHASGGWAEPDYKSGSFNVYFPIKLATKAQIVGKWENKNLMTMGTMGGGAPMVAAGSNNDLAFNPDGTFVKDGKSFASATTANMGDAFKSGGDTTVTGGGKSGSKGQWRLDGPLLTTVEDGHRGVQLLFILPEWGKDNEPPELLIQGDRWERPKKK